MSLLTIDLGLAVVGFSIFGATIASGHGPVWTFMGAVKFSALFLTTFLLSVPTLFALKRLFQVERPFSEIVSIVASNFGLGGIFASVLAGPYLLVRRSNIDFNGTATIIFVALIVAGVLTRQIFLRSPWMPRMPSFIGASIVIALLGQSAWAYRPYMDPSQPTLFQARLEWFTGAERAELERMIIGSAKLLGTGPAPKAVGDDETSNDERTTNSDQRPSQIGR